MNDIYSKIYSYTESIPVINTHSHHREDDYYSNFDLRAVIESSYVSLCGLSLDDTAESRQSFLEKVKYKSYFVWLEKALQRIYNFTEPISVNNWDEISSKIKHDYSNKNNHLDILMHHCKYEKTILDASWKTGSTNNHPDFFVPTFRINMFLFGYDRQVLDHNGCNPLTIYNIETGDIDEYISNVRRVIIQKKNEGCVALKSALAYDRGLDFVETSKEKAQEIFDRPIDTLADENIKAFGDYVFFEICKIAAELDLPLQCHTGLGILKKSNAMQMREVIEKNPHTKFVLFHGSYPWLEDIYALSHNYGNVYPDLCWLPIISSTAAKRMIEELIDVCTADKVCWGCDTATSDESLGALLAVRHVLSETLSRKVKEGYMTIDGAKEVAYNILYKNAKQLYKL